MYDPPSKTNWYHVGYFQEIYQEYYNKGYDDAKNGNEYSEPFEPSGYERDISFHDELNYWYYSGYYDYEN